MGGAPLCHPSGPALAENIREISGIRVARQAPRVSHLLFADDSILFFGVNQTEISTVSEILITYESASGQRINLGKSELTTSRQHLRGKKEGNWAAAWSSNNGSVLEELIQEGSAWLVGNGSLINCSNDRWIGSGLRTRPPGRLQGANRPDLVSSLLLQNPTRWNVDTIGRVFDEDTTTSILTTPLSSRNLEDRRIWNHTNTGKFTIHSAYFLEVDRFSKCGRNLASASSGKIP
ncbi:hypothetical protein ACS0TY_014176 [Phlomoides rotata]